ncbi:hypothetical protein P4S55_17735 [Shewanella sp. PP-Sp27a-2]
MIIDIVVNGQVISITRSATDPVPSNISFITKPIIFSQTEIETVSLNSEGKLNLIDSFVSGLEIEHQNISQVSAEIRSLYATYMNTKNSYNEASDHTLKKNELLRKESNFIEQQKIYSQDNTAFALNKQTYDNLQTEIGTIEVEVNNITHLQKMFITRTYQLESILTKSINTNSGTSELSRSASLYSMANELLEQENILITQAIDKNKLFIQQINNELNELNEKKNELEGHSRNYRGEISKVTENAGIILSQLSQIRSQLSQITSWEHVVTRTRLQMNSLYEEIQSRIALLLQARTNIYNKRSDAAAELNRSLNPYISIEIQFSADQTHYKEALINALKGSGLRYNEIVDDITSKFHPQWLFYYIFTSRFEEFSNVLNMPLDRSSRLLSYLRDVDLGVLLTTRIDDKIDFYLLDKGCNKKVEELSIGQRCTVALSIILENKNRVLIIDQPEDHLDNEFIASTLISSLVKRSAEVQTIISSHNANIPVLGDAKMVINLDSNGRKGFIKNAGPIASPHIRHAIESIMEGGKEAFQRRSNFYAGK